MYFLADKSAHEQTKYSRVATQRYEELMFNGSLATCEVTNLEILYSPRSPKRYPEGAKLLGALPSLSVHNSALRLASMLQARLAVIELIAEVAELRHEWILERGTGHGTGSSA